MMALDGKTIIKEEITDKDTYEAAGVANSSRRVKVNNSSTTAASKDCSTLNSINPGSNNSSNSSAISNPNGTTSTSSRSCRTPDSPESARAIAPRSPMSPQLHHSGLAPPTRPNRNASASPVVNGATTTPPLPLTAQQQPSQAAVAAAAAAAAHVEQARLLVKIRKFLGSLVQLAQEVHPDVSERVRALVLSLASAGISIDEFRMALQEAINLPLRPYVIPLLKNHISLLQREIVALARVTNQTTHQYVSSNENAVMEFTAHGPSPEYSDIFVQIDGPQSASNGGATSLVFKRRASDTLMDSHHNGMQDWSEYMQAAYPNKRLHVAAHQSQQEARMSFGMAQPTIFDYSTTGAASQAEGGFSSLMEKATNHREERDREMRASAAAANEAAARHATRNSVPNAAAGGGSGGGAGTAGIGGEEEWKSIHTMLNCISAMVDKTKRAITILQQRGVEPQAPNYSDISAAALVEIRRQTEEKVAEFKRNAEEAVNQVKRQAVIEIQRAVVTAETRAAEVMTQERLRMEKFFVDMSRNPGSERELDNKSPSIASGQNACWNCGRKATETCSGCNLARYCGAFCQHKDWEHHHQICGTTRTADLSAKHAASQVIPLTASMRGSLARSPPTPTHQATAASVAGAATQSAPTPTSSSGVVNTQQASSLIANGIGSK